MPFISGGGGGASAVLQTTVTLTNAQVKALPTTSGSAPFGLEVLASPGAGTALLPISGMLVKYGVAYTNVNAAATLTLAYSGFNTTDQSPEILCGGGGFLDTALDETATIPLTGWAIAATLPPASIFPEGFSSPLTGVAGLGLILSASNASAGNFTGGAVGNSLVMHLLYAVRTV